MLIMLNLIGGVIQPLKINHRLLIMYAAGAVGCNYQDTTAHSSSEAEFMATCDVGKLFLFFRSLLMDLNVE
jgi:hypothetical protein